MDRSTKIYALILAALMAVLLVLFLYQPSIVRELNTELESDPQLKVFPYPFQVIRVEDNTAVMSTPRSFEMPVQRMIHTLEPKLKNASPDDVAFQQAQQTLADHQTLARSIVLAHPAIQSVTWELDKDWLQQHGVALP